MSESRRGNPIGTRNALFRDLTRQSQDPRLHKTLPTKSISFNVLKRKLHTSPSLSLFAELNISDSFSSTRPALFTKLSHYTN